jgi:hypothetical protein
MRAALACGALAACVGAAALAVPLSPADVAKLCSEAEGPAHCGRLVEGEQLKRLPGLAVRDGATLRLSLFPSGSVAFTDVDTASGGSSYALWDYMSEINAAVLWTTKDDDVGFLLVQRTAGGRQTPLPAEPVISPDRQRFATADFCASRCENKLAVWRMTRDGARRELEWRAGEPWSDAVVRWKDAETLVVEYTRDDDSEPRTLSRKLADPGWSRLDAAR